MSAEPLPPRLSTYGKDSIRPTPVSQMMEAFCRDFRPGTDINLGVGYVNEATMPKEDILEAAHYVLANRQEYPHPLNYGEPPGSRALVRALQRFLLRCPIEGLTPELLASREWVIGTGGVTSLLEGIARIMEPGVVLTSDPYYYIYADVLRRLGFTVISVEEDSDGIRVDQLEAAAHRHMKQLSFLYIVTIGNPTSSILSNQRRRELARLAAELSKKSGRQIPCFIDGAYELLIHDPNIPLPLNVSSLDQAGVIYELGTLSKVLAPSLRIGYLMGPPGPLLEAVSQHNSDVAFSAPQFNQDIATHLLDHSAESHRKKVNAAYRRKSKIIDHALNGALGNHLERVVGGGAGFYYYLTLRRIPTHAGSALLHHLGRTTGDPQIDGAPGQLKSRLVVLPGEYFVNPTGAGAERGRRQLRLSYGYASESELPRAMAHLAQAVDYAGAVGD